MIHSTNNSFTSVHFLNKHNFFPNTYALCFDYYKMFQLFMSYVSNIQCLRYLFNFKTGNKMLSNTRIVEPKLSEHVPVPVPIYECDDVVKPHIDIEKAQVPEYEVIIDENVPVENIVDDVIVPDENISIEDNQVQVQVQDVPVENVVIEKRPFKFTNKTIGKAIKKYFSPSATERNDALVKYGHISTWDVSKVTDMRRLFFGSVLFSDISGWDVSNVIDFSEMFKNATIHNVSLKDWNVEKALSMYSMFEGATFENETIGIEEWKLNGNVDLRRAFYMSSLKLKLENWNIGKSWISGMLSFSNLTKSDVESWNNQPIVEKIHLVFQK